MVFEYGPEYPSQCAAIESIAATIGCSGETVRSWDGRSPRVQGERVGLTVDQRRPLKELE